MGFQLKRTDQISYPSEYIKENPNTLNTLSCSQFYLQYLTPRFTNNEISNKSQKPLGTNYMSRLINGLKIEISLQYHESAVFVHKFRACAG